MTPENYAQAVEKQSGALDCTFVFDDYRDCWQFEWVFYSKATKALVRVGCKTTPELFEGIADEDGWVKVTVEHLHNMLGKSDEDRRTVFRVNSDKEYIYD